MSGTAWRTMTAAEHAEYMAGRRYGACDARSDVFQPQAFANEPADFRQGYVDGWEAQQDGS